MGDVTAVNMDVVTDKSGHVFTPCAVSVCTTPAAPAPLPIPYPVIGNTSDGATAPAMRTAINGAKVITVGSVFTACHGNEAGTLKEVVSLNTGGPCLPLIGAPTVLVELGMQAITGSFGIMNKGVTVGPGGSTSGADGSAGSASGGGGGGGSADGDKAPGPNGGGGSGGGGSGSGASQSAAGEKGQAAQGKEGDPGKSSAPTQEKCTEGGHPVDVASGFVVDREIDLQIDGLIPLLWKRHYSSARRHETKRGLGQGWAHTYEQWIEEADRLTVLFDGEGREIYFDKLRDGEHVFHRGERSTLHRDAEGEYRVFDHTTRLTSVFKTTKSGGRALLHSIVDSYKNAIRFEYDDQRRLARIVDTVGREVIVSWKKDRIARWEVRVGGALEQWSDYRYSRGGCLIAATDANGFSDEYEYDASDRMKSVTLKNGTKFHYEYDENDRCVKTWGPDGLYALELEYDVEARTTRTKGEEPREYRWNARGLVERIATPDGVVIVERTYDDDDYLLAEVGGDGLGDRFWHDEQGRLTRRVDAAENVTAYEYGGEFLAKRISPDGHVTSYGHDTLGAVVSIQYPTGAHRTISRDDRGRLTMFADSDGERRIYEYDGENNVIVEIDAKGARATYGYDSMGRSVRLTDALGRASSVVYDRMGHVTSRRYADGTSSQLQYGALGRVERVTNAAGESTTIEYQGMGVRTRIVEPDGRVWKLAYTSNERLRQIENPAGEIYAFRYDDAGRVVQERTFDGRELAYDYDRSGRLARIRYPDKTVRGFVYDRLGNLVEEQSNDAKVAYERDRVGRMMRGILEEEGRTHETKLERDPFGRVIAEHQGDVRIRFAYDTWGRRTSRTLPHGAVTHYAYDPNGALVEIAHASHRVVFDRDDVGRVVKSTVDDGRFEILTGYDARDRRIGERVAAPTPGSELPTILVQRQWRRDVIGRVTRIEDARWGVTDYQYDRSGQLVGAQRGKRAEAFAYDDEGSIVEMLESLVGGKKRASAQWEVDPGNILKRTKKAKYTYDRRRRRTVKLALNGGAKGAATEYRWDCRDRLREVRLPNGRSVRFDYDAFGRRVAKTVMRGNVNERAVQFIWDGNALAGEFDSQNGARWFVHQPSTLWPVFQEQRGEVFTYVNDHIGTPRELVDGQGRVSWAATHSAFGAVVDARVDETAETQRGYRVDSPFRLLGQYADEETGLCHTLYRYFDPEVGRWCSPDPLGFRGGTNLSAFGGTPITHVDPLGLAHNEEDGENKDGKDKEKLPRFDGPKPTYAVNPAHDPNDPLGRFNPKKTPLPDDAEQVYKNAVPDSPVSPRNWYGKNEDGSTYRFSGGNDGTAHYSGQDDKGDGIRNITPYAKDRLSEKDDG